MVVVNNNIYYLDDINGDDYVKLTSDGETDVVFNGIPDWLYEGKL